jgi:hypothetical protein
MIELSFDLIKKAMFLMEENSYQNLCLLESSTTNPLAIYRYDVDDKKKYYFKKDFNKNAELIVFPKENYLKFSFPININTPEDRSDRRKNGAGYLYMTLQQRGQQNRPTVETFIDGVKIPDAEVLLTIFDGGLDLYVPKKYAKTDSFKINLLINKYTGNDGYFNHFNTSNNGRTVIISDIDTRNLDLKVDNLKLYRNGLLQNAGTDYEMYIVGQQIFIDYKQYLEKTDVSELVYYPHCIYSRQFSEKADELIDLPESVIKDLPISPELLEVHHNGRRLFSQDIEVLTARHFRIKDFGKSNHNTDIRIHYNPQAVTNANSYMDDILQFFKFKNRQSIVDILLHHLGEVPDWIKNMKFPPEYSPVHNVNPYQDGKTYNQWVVETIKKYITTNSQNLRYLLQMFAGLDDFIFRYASVSVMQRNDTRMEMGEFNYTKFDKPKVVFSLKSKLTNFDLMAFLNDDKLYRSEVLYFNHMGNTYIYVDADKLVDNDTVRVRLLPIFNRPQRAYTMEITEENLGEFFFSVTTETFGTVRDLADIRVMKRKGNGWVFCQLGEHYFVERDGDRIIRIYIGSRKVGDVFFIYNSSFFDYNYHVFKDETDDCLKIPFDVLDATRTFYVPRLSNYTHTIFVNRKMYIEGLDYFVSTQMAHADINVAKINFKSIPNPGDKFEIYYYEQNRQKLAAVEKVDSALGLIYLRDLAFPFDLNYLDLYINGRKVTKADIEIISDRLIRIINPDFKPPFIDVVVYSNLQLPTDVFGEYTDVYNDKPKGWDDYIREEYVDKGRLDDLYDEAFPDIPRLPIDPNLNPRNRMNPLLDRIAKMLISGELKRRLDANIWTTIFNELKFVEIMDKEDKDRPEILIDPNATNILVDTRIDCVSTLKPAEEIISIIGDHLQNGLIPSNIDANEPVPDYDQLPISDLVYEEELALFNPNNHADVGYNFDANDTAENGYLTKVVEIDLSNKPFILVGDEEDSSRFYQEYDTKPLDILQVLSLQVNNVTYGEGAISYNPATGRVRLDGTYIKKGSYVIMRFVERYY